jgi:response regulator RpfG family c-di-GMP phosphodiesterase
MKLCSIDSPPFSPIGSSKIGTLDWDFNRRIGSLSVLLAALLGMGEEEQKLIGNHAPLHGIGKLAVPESILLKPQRGKHLDPRLADFVLENFGAFQECIVGSAEAV